MVPVGTYNKRTAVAEFEKWVRQREAALAQDQHHTIGELFDMYIVAMEQARKPSATRIRHNWKALKPMFGALQPADVATPYKVRGEMLTRCHAYAVQRAEQGRARDTIATELNVLRMIFAWAETHNKIVKAPHVWINKAGLSREHQLTLDDVTKLLGCAGSSHIRLALLLALFTGARKAAITELTWSQVDFTRNTIDFRVDMVSDDILDSSHKKGRAFVDMHPVLRLALAEAKEVALTDYVLEWHGKAVDDVKKGVRRAFERAGLAGQYRGLHSLRKTLATIAADRGIDMRQIQKMLGHDDIRTTEKHYSKHLPGYTLPVAEALTLSPPKSENLEQTGNTDNSDKVANGSVT